MTGRRALFWSIVLAICGLAAIEALLDLAGEAWLEYATTPVSAGGLGLRLSPIVLDLIDLPITLALAILVAVWLSGRLTRPLRSLTHATEQLAAEQFPEPLPVPRGNVELARLARSFNRMSAALRALLERERTFTRYATHELRTPLSALKLQVERAQRDASAPSPTLDAMARNVQRMEEVIGALLQLTRSGERDRSPTPLVDVIDETFAALSPSVRDQVDLMSLPPEVRVTDGALVQRALHNLIVNAVVHGAVPVQVYVGRDGENLTLRVRDRGEGVPEATLGELARPFVRSATGGTGLGLALVAFIAQTLGGDVALRNLRPGFEASLRLPVIVDGAPVALAGRGRGYTLKPGSDSTDGP